MLEDQNLANAIMGYVIKEGASCSRHPLLAANGTFLKRERIFHPLSYASYTLSNNLFSITAASALDALAFGAKSPSRRKKAALQEIYSSFLRYDN